MNTLNLTRADAEELCGAVPRNGTWRAANWVFEYGGTRLLVKDIRYSAPVFRRTVGRLLLRHMIGLHRRMEGLSFVPRYLGTLDGDGFVMEQVESVPLKRLRPGQVSNGFFERLAESVETLHRSGIVHLDLRHRDNILVVPVQRPMLVDFETSLYLGKSFISRRLLVPLLSAVDRSALLKLKLRYLPESVSAEELSWYRSFRILRLLWPFKHPSGRWLSRRMHRKAAAPKASLRHAPGGGRPGGGGLRSGKGTAPLDPSTGRPP